MDKTVVRKFRLGEEPKEYTYWLTQSAECRIAGIEALRRQYYGEDPFKQGLQRVYRITKQE
jgi:hypothetical protein